MKILLVCQYFYPEQFRVNDICFQLVQEGHQVTVLTGLPNYPSGIVAESYKWFKNRTEKINGVSVIRSWLLARGKGKIRLALNYLSFAVTATTKAFTLKKDFDLILVYQLSPITMALPGIVLKRLTNKPLIIYCHDLWPESIQSVGISSDSIIYNIVLKLSKWIYKQADQIFISSNLFAEYFKTVLERDDNINYLPVYAESLFEEIRSRNRHETDKINLVFAGNIGEMQSVETIIYAANELTKEPLIQFHIVGDGSSRNKCEDLTRQLGLSNVTFHGQHPLHKMPQFYEMADAFLVTLRANKIISYTLPNKVQSYLAAGKPIIGAIDGETQILIRKANCGLCAPADDYKELADNIRKFVKEKDKQAVYAHNAKEYYEKNFSSNRYMEKLNALLIKVKLDWNEENV